MFRSTTLLFLVVFTACANAQEPADDLEQLAASGQIHQSAPVKASAEISIHASPDKVWQVLTDIDNWPKWQANISVAKIDGALQSGTNFTWITGGIKIESRIALVQPSAQFAWTGTAKGTRAIHVWTLQPLPTGDTKVTTTESMDGFLLRFLYSSKSLAKTDQAWLDALKHKSEEQ